MNASPEASPRRTALIVFVLAFCTLMFELVLSRMSVFYLNYANSFLAIPLTLFGLAIGSLRVHLGRTPPESVDLPRSLILLTLVSALSFAAVFFLFSRFFPITHRNNPTGPTMVAKTVVFVLVFLPPFFFAGKILTALYATNRRIIGRLYGFDLLGASLACFATPVLFHFIDLPYLISVCLVAMTVVTALALGRGRLTRVAPFVALVLALLPLLVHLEGRYDMRRTVAGSSRTVVEEIAHRWNEFSRVSLLRVTEPGRRPSYKIIHDNAESNVKVGRYDPAAPEMPRELEVRVPFVLGRRTDDVMVMFAGCGKQMIDFHTLGGGARNLVGVEINPLVIDFAVATPEIADYRIREFYDLPNVEMAVAEGRSYLDNDRRAYDVIYVGSDAATAAYKTGHSRKYLDTKEAMAAYLDHLRNDGLLIFRCQPMAPKVDVLKALFAERSLGDLSRHVFLAGKSLENCGNLVLSLVPFSEEDVRRLTDLYAREHVRYAPGYARNNRRLEEMIAAPLSADARLVTDDRPFLHPLDFENYELFPPLAKLSSIRYYRSWIKITTMVVVLGALLVILAGLYLFRLRMPPARMMVYLLVTGFCYMLVEIAFISKLELFLENPLYSMALLLSIFLLTNAAGSMLYQRLRARLPMTLAPLAVAGIVLACLAAMDAIIHRRLGLPLPIKILLTIAVVSPVGVCLGLFYPYVVTWLTDRNRPEAVPITYGISTLSSVAGATYAMTMMINFGFAHIVHQAAIGYAALAVFMLVANRVRG